MQYLCNKKPILSASSYMSSKKETGQEKTLNLAHHDYEKGLNLYAFSKVHNKSTSDDLVQDTFIKTWRFLVRKGKIHVMKAFLYHVLNGLIVDEYRKRKFTSLETLIEKGFEPSIDSSEQLLNALDGKTALLLIERLPEKYKRAMKMKYVQLLTLKEMSLITGETKNTIAVQIHRGLEKLKLLYNHSLIFQSDQ
jgi:RNA polymerase sigma-70 factor, ECF subfamily